MRQLVIRGPATGPEGYAEVTRGFLQAFDEAGWNIKLEPFVAWGPWQVGLPVAQHKALQRCIANKIYPQKQPVPYLHVCLPEQVRVDDRYHNINYTMFEADRIAQQWVEALRVVDKVVIPNSFCHSVFHRSGVPKKKLATVPLGFNPEIFNRNVEPLPLTCNGRPLSDFPIRILSILEVTNRKNFGGLLELYFRVAAQLGPESCCLILKAANYSTHLPLADKVRMFRDRFIREKKIPEAKYNVCNYSPLVPVGDMGAFMQTASHYLSVSLAEGWDLNCLNAMACGIPVIIPNHSGYTAYCDESNACCLPTAKKILAEQQGATSRLYNNANWFAPDGDEAARIATDYIRDGVESEKRATNAHDMVHSHYTWKVCARMLEDEL